MVGTCGLVSADFWIDQRMLACQLFTILYLLITCLFTTTGRSWFFSKCCFLLNILIYFVDLISVDLLANVYVAYMSIFLQLPNIASYLNYQSEYKRVKRFGILPLLFIQNFGWILYSWILKCRKQYLLLFFWSTPIPTHVYFLRKALNLPLVLL